MAPQVIVDKPPGLAEALAGRFVDEARKALDARRLFAVALPGGSVADRFFPRLAETALDWSRVHFFWGDERAVPPTDPESNYRAARTLWLEPAGVPATSVHRMEAEAPDAEAAARAYADTLTRVLGSPPRLDLVLLGVGPDGHVCSLFPGHPLLGEEGRLVAVVEDSPKPPARRMTLTLPALAAAGLVVVAALGGSKAEVVREALEGAGSELPLARVVRRARRCVFYLDDAAAAGVGRG